MAARRKTTPTPAEVAEAPVETTEVEAGSVAPVEEGDKTVESDVDHEAIAAIEAAAAEDLPEPPEQEFIQVNLGDSSQRFIKGHALPVADLLDALDGRTERVFTTKTHILTRYSQYGIPSHFHDPDLLIELENGDSFRADLRLLG